MNLLDVEQMLAASDQKTRTVDVPEWGGQVGLRSLTAEERDQWEMATEAEGGRKLMRARLIGMSLCDAEGKRLEITELQITALANKSAAAMERLFDAVLELNKMRKQDTEAAAKNSEAVGDDSD